MLAKINGEKYTGDAKAKAKMYQEDVRVWIYDEENLVLNLAQFKKDFESTCNEEGKQLFTDITDKRIVEQMKKATYIVDNLTKDDL